MNSSALIGRKLIKKNPLQDFLSSLNAVISTNESTEFITGHVIYKPGLQIPAENHLNVLCQESSESLLFSFYWTVPIRDTNFCK